MALKHCSRCKNLKDLSEFNSNKAQKDGLSNQCIICTRLSSSEYKQRKKLLKIIPPISEIKGEIFKPVIYKGIEFEYKISNKGRLISLKNGFESLMTPTQEPGKCGRPGYLSTALRHPDKSKSYSVRMHVLVGIAFVPNPDNLKQINHEDGNKTNNNDWNLKWSTSLYNIQHSFATGLNIAKKGTESPQFNRGKKVIYNGIIYNSIAGLSRSINVPRTSISNELGGRMKTKIGVQYVD